MGTADNGGRFADGTGDVTENVVMRLVFHDCIPYTDGSGNFWNIQKHWKYHKFKTVASQEMKKKKFWCVHIYQNTNENIQGFLLKASKMGRIKKINASYFEL